MVLLLAQCLEVPLSGAWGLCGTGNVKDLIAKQSLQFNDMSPGTPILLVNQIVFKNAHILLGFKRI